MRNPETGANAPLFRALSDRYRVERELGAGGMSTVYLAEDLRHGRLVAIKVLHPHLAATLGTERFLAEIRTTAKLHHAHVLPLFDSGEASGHLFYVMPFVDGHTLRDRLTRERSLTIEEAIRLSAEIADALAYAHGQGIVHRDIKPENVLLSSGHAYVADFGIARAASVASDNRITQTGVAIGTPAYMSPEQMFAEREIDGRADIFSLGCVLFEMLAGESPFHATNDSSTLAKRMMQPAPSVASKRIDTPPWLVEVVGRAIAREPKDRFQTAGAMVHSLTLARGAVPHGRNEMRCISVLPFANMSVDSDAEFFSDGMTDEILNMLVTLPGLAFRRRPTRREQWTGLPPRTRQLNRRSTVRLLQLANAQPLIGGRELHAFVNLVEREHGAHRGQLDCSGACQHVVLPRAFDITPVPQHITFVLRHDEV